MDATDRREAVDRAYREYRADVYRVTYAILRDPGAAEDAMHDAFGRAFEHWHEYDPQRPLRPWLQAIATRRALDLLRGRKVRALAIPWLNAEARRREQVAGDLAESLSLRDRLDREMDRISPRPRAALILRHYYGYPYAEIGELVGLSSGTVGSLISRAHAHLRDRLLADAEPGADAPDAAHQPEQEVLP